MRDHGSPPGDAAEASGAPPAAGRAREPAAYGDAWAPVYDEMYHQRLPTDATVEAIARLADGGPVLELGAGTGRLAIPLAERGLEVVALDSSDEMLDHLRARSATVRTVCADMTTVTEELVGGPFAVVFCIFNGLLLLADQDAQVRCISAAAPLLAPSGRLVVEHQLPHSAFEGVPKEALRLPDGAGTTVLETVSHDPFNQLVVATQVLVHPEHGVLTLPTRIRYVWPGELDLMARIAGLRVAERWGDWTGRRAVGSDTTHIAILSR